MRYKGILYPLIKHPQGFFHNAASDIAQIKADMATVILTEPEERLFLPYFGVSFRKINLNSPAEVVKSEIRMNIASALKKWEKRVQVHDVVVDLARNNEDKLVVKISVLFIDPTNINNIENLTVYKSIGGIHGKHMPF